MTRIGIQISSVRPYLQTPEDVLAAFNKVSQIGYRTIQIQWIAPSVPSNFIRDALQETHLDCVGTQDFTDEVLAQWDEVVAQNDLWGGTNICVSGIPERYQSADGAPDGVLAFARDLNQRAKQLAAQGKVISFHPRASDVIYFGQQTSLDLILENTHQSVQFVLDVYHLVKAGLDPVTWIHKVQGRGDLIHFKDMTRGPDGKEVLMPVGQGSIDWAPVIQACQEAGVKYAFAEQERWEKDPFECLRESYAYMVGLGIEQGK